MLSLPVEIGGVGPRDAAGSLLTLMAVPAVQLGTFLLCARALPIEDFAALVVFQASAAILVEIAGLGMSEVLVRNVARDKGSYGQSLLDCLLVMAPSIVAAAGLNALVQQLSFDAGGLVMLGALFGAAEIASQRLLMLWEQVAIAHGAVVPANRVRLCPALLRIACVGALVLMGSATLPWTVAAFAGSGLAAAAMVSIWGVRRFGPPSGRVRFDKATDGIPFALNQVLRAAQFNFDRLVLQLVLGPAQVAAYAAAMKFVQVGGLPVVAMSRIWYPHMFAAGAGSMTELRALATKLVVPVLFASTVSAFCLVALAPLLPLILGAEFGPSVLLLQIAAPVLVISASGYVGGDMLTGSNRQYLRVILFAGAVTAQAVAVALLAEGAGEYGAVASLYLSASLFAIGCWLAGAARAAGREAAMAD